MKSDRLQKEKQLIRLSLFTILPNNLNIAIAVLNRQEPILGDLIAFLS